MKTTFRQTALVITPIAAAAILIAGCGGGATEKPNVTVRPKNVGGGGSKTKTVTNGSGTKTGGGVGTLKGTVTYTATAEKPKLLFTADETKDKFCASVASKAISNRLIVGPEKQLKNVVVYLRRAPEGSFQPPSKNVDFTNKNCMFDPHIIVARTGQKVLIGNDDQTAHNTHTFPNRNPSENFKIDQGSKPFELVYQNPEPGPVRVKCDFHKWMLGYHVVVDHPFVAVSDENGEFSIKELPAGKHTFILWHEALPRPQTRTITIQPGQETPIKIEFNGTSFAVNELPRSRNGSALAANK